MNDSGNKEMAHNAASSTCPVHYGFCVGPPLHTIRGVVSAREKKKSVPLCLLSLGVPALGVS
jgi:hypothetical protein